MSRLLYDVVYHMNVRSLEFNFVDFELLQYISKTFTWYLITRKQFILEIHKINPMQNFKPFKNQNNLFAALILLFLVLYSRYSKCSDHLEWWLVHCISWRRPTSGLPCARQGNSHHWCFDLWKLQRREVPLDSRWYVQCGAREGHWGNDWGHTRPFVCFIVTMNALFKTYMDSEFEGKERDLIGVLRNSFEWSKSNNGQKCAVDNEVIAELERHLDKRFERNFICTVISKEKTKLVQWK